MDQIRGRRAAVITHSRCTKCNHRIDGLAQRPPRLATPENSSRLEFAISCPPNCTPSRSQHLPGFVEVAFSAKPAGPPSELSRRWPTVPGRAPYSSFSVCAVIVPLNNRSTRWSRQDQRSLLIASRSPWPSSLPRQPRTPSCYST